MIRLLLLLILLCQLAVSQTTDEMPHLCRNNSDCPNGGTRQNTGTVVKRTCAGQICGKDEKCVASKCVLDSKKLHGDGGQGICKKDSDCPGFEWYCNKFGKCVDKTVFEE